MKIKNPAQGSPEESVSGGEVKVSKKERRSFTVSRVITPGLEGLNL